MTTPTAPHAPHTAARRGAHTRPVTITTAAPARRTVNITGAERAGRVILGFAGIITGAVLLAGRPPHPDGACSP
jgi:hypothetical protein